MIQYTNEQLASVIALPIVTILLVWTTAIFQKNRKKWGPYDIPIVALLILSIIRNLTILAYTLFVTLNQNTIDIDYCSGIIWIFNSIHTFQASSLTTLAIIGLFSVKLHRKQEHIKQYLTATHLIYHLFCLTTLCACVGVAAILARNDRIGHFKNITVFDSNPCKFMPFDLDIKYNVFIIVLNVFLASVSLVTFFAICYHHFKLKRKNDFDYLQKSNSDLSDLSLQQQEQQHNNNKNNNGYYDTYTIQRNHYQPPNCYEQHGGWTSDVSNISNTVSSTNSRRPCLTTTLSTSSAAQTTLQKDEKRTGLETIHPVLIVCYLFYHLPIIILCIYPEMISPWPIAGIALWLGLVQDLLIPIGLSIVDTRFCKWVSNVYKCSDRHGDDKLPHVGLDGKFRPFTSQPQSLEVTQNMRALQTVEHRFPITNGSLYTSIDGRLPVIHNYRRHNKDQRILKQTEAPSMHQAVFDYTCRNCEADLCPSHSNLHHLSPQYINKQLNLMQNSKPAEKPRISLSQESLRYIPEHQNFHHQEAVIKNSRNLVRLNKMRLCKSEDSLVDPKPPKTEPMMDYSSSDDDYLTDNNNGNDNFDSLSSQSSYSITTEANCDFEFFQSSNNNNKKVERPQQPPPPPPSVQKMTSFKQLLDNGNCKITRSNSKRSLENFCNAYIVEENDYFRGNKIQRSNSYMTLEDRKRRNKGLLRTNSKLSDCSHNINNKFNGQKIKSVEYLPSSNASTVYVEDVFYFNYPKRQQKQFCDVINNNVNQKNYVGNSVPDLKKVFISEYI